MWSLDELTQKILSIDLSSGQIIKSQEAPEQYRYFLGGRGLDQYYLYNLLDPATRPFDSENPLIFGAGLLCGTPFPSATRISIDSKNAFSGGVGSANAADGFSSTLKRSGFGTVIIRGKSKNPVYLHIADDTVQIRPAGEFWGKTVSVTVETLRKATGKTADVACIGPAGENLVRGACIMVNGSRAAAKCGLGAVMGSKNLKAIVVQGVGVVRVAEEQKFASLCRKMWSKLKKSSSAQRMSALGTKAAFKGKNAVCAVAYRHFQDGYVQSLEGLDEEAFNRFEQKERFSCKGCPVTCRQKFRIDEGPYTGSQGEAVHCNTIQDFGSKLDIRYTPAIIKANLLCNDYGIDIDTASESIAWAFECYEKGLISEKDTDGLSLAWGNHKALIDLIELMAKRQGFGDILAEGVKGAAARIGRGTEEFAITMKGQDLYEDPRIPKGYGLGVALSTRGGGHCSGSPQVEFFGEIKDDVSSNESFFDIESASNPATYSDKGKLVAYHERLHAVINSLGLCFFTSRWVGNDLLDEQDYADVVAASTGWEMDASELMLIGERIHNVERLFNALHADFDRKDDYPADKFFCEPIKSGPFKGTILDRDQFDSMLNQNYAVHGWDKQGLPKMETLRTLELDLLLKRLPGYLHLEKV
jgi:aldehyde:ferredoxin oxidoreductase